MPTARDFRTIQIQAAWFTSAVRFRPASVVSYFLSKHGERFDGQSVSYPSQEPPSSAPAHVFLSSKDNRIRLAANPARLDIIWEEHEAVADAAVVEFLRSAAEIAIDYLSEFHGNAKRAAYVLTRMADNKTPGLSLKKHFCQQRWVDGPMKSDGDFELHDQARRHLGKLFEINSWVRCKVVAIKVRTREPPTHVIMVEQEFNSLFEQMELRALTAEEIREFSRLAPEEFHRVLALYFPDRT